MSNRFSVGFGAAIALLAVFFATTANAYCAPGERCLVQQPGRVFIPQGRPQIFRQVIPGGQLRPGGAREFQRFGGASNMAGPGMGPHGHPMIQGVRGWHEAHNRSSMQGALPAAVFGLTGGSAVDVESYIDNIDVSSPIEPTSSCNVNPCFWGAISAAANGATASATNAGTPEQARSAALQGCLQNSQGNPCGGNFLAVGNQWIVAIYCQNNQAFNTLLANGDNFGAALRNDYRTAFQQFGFAVDDCGVINAIAADGSQSNYAGQE